MGPVRQALLARLAGMPRTHRALRWLARRRAGSHYVAVVAVLLDGDDVLIAEHSFRAHAWALPGGWVHRLEDPRRAVERELAEELGVEAQALDVVGCELHGSPGPTRPSSMTVAIRCRLAPTSDGGRADVAPASSELRAARWAGPSEVAERLTAFERSMISQARLVVDR